MRKNLKIQKAKSLVTKLNRYIYFCIDQTRDDSYFCIFIDMPVARIYSYNGKWYIWYIKQQARKSVKNFTSALNLLEKEMELACTV